MCRESSRSWSTLGPAVLALALGATGPLVLVPVAQADATSGTPLPGNLQQLPQGPAFDAPRPSGRVEVWIDLDMPPLAAMPSLDAAQRVAYRHEIDAQQSLLVERLRRWGAEERARVQIVRNAVVVEVPESALEEIRQLQGVARVQRVTHRHRIHTPASTDNR